MSTVKKKKKQAKAPLRLNGLHRRNNALKVSIVTHLDELILDNQAHAAGLRRLRDYVAQLQLDDPAWKCVNHDKAHAFFCHNCGGFQMPCTYDIDDEAEPSRYLVEVLSACDYWVDAKPSQFPKIFKYWFDMAYAAAPFGVYESDEA